MLWLHFAPLFSAFGLDRSYKIEQPTWWLKDQSIEAFTWVTLATENETWLRWTKLRKVNMIALHMAENVAFLMKLFKVILIHIAFLMI